MNMPCVHIAILSGQVRIVELLVKAGADLFVNSGTNKYNAFEMAISQDNPDILRVLMPHCPEHLREGVYILAIEKFASRCLALSYNVKVDVNHALMAAYKHAHQGNEDALFCLEKAGHLPMRRLNCGFGLFQYAIDQRDMTAMKTLHSVFKRLQAENDRGQWSLTGIKFVGGEENASGVKVKFKSGKAVLTVVDTMLHYTARAGFGFVQACDWWPELFGLANELGRPAEAARAHGFERIGHMMETMMARKMQNCAVDVLEAKFMQIVGLEKIVEVYAKKKLRSQKTGSVRFGAAAAEAAGGDLSNASGGAAEEGSDLSSASSGAAADVCDVSDGCAAAVGVDMCQALTRVDLYKDSDESLSSDIDTFPDTSSKHTKQYLGPDNECTLCMDQPRTHAFIPCGHFSICGSCAELCKQKVPLQCLQCCQPADGVFRIFYS